MRFTPPSNKVLFQSLQLKAQEKHKLFCCLRPVIAQGYTNGILCAVRSHADIQIWIIISISGLTYPSINLYHTILGNRKGCLRQEVRMGRRTQLVGFAAGLFHVNKAHFFLGVRLISCYEDTAIGTYKNILHQTLFLTRAKDKQAGKQSEKQGELQ